MRIVVDMNHPADFHYYKNFIREMRKRGHKILITASEKDVSLKLLDRSGMDYAYMGNYGTGLLNKMINTVTMDVKMYRAARRFSPDLFLGLGSIRATHASFLLGRSSINFEDTEIQPEQTMLYLPVVSVIWTPSCFKRDLGKKHVRCDGYKELAYLHPDYFEPDPRVLEEVGLKTGEAFAVLRFVSWDATHDIGHHGLSDKMVFIKELEKHIRVLVTSETVPEPELEKYLIKLPPEKLHDLLYYASLYVGEGATMATEAAVLGTPSIYASSVLEKLGYISELRQKYGLLFCYDNQDQVLSKAIELISTPNIKETWRAKRDRMIDDKIDMTAFMVWFVENYPESFRAVKDDPGLQYHIRKNSQPSNNRAMEQFTVTY